MLTFVGWREKISRTRSALGSLSSYVNVHGEEELRRRAGPERTLVERQTIRMCERREETWRPLTRRRVAAFVELYLLSMVYVENGHRRGRQHPVTTELLKKALVKRIIPFIDRRLVWTMDETLWPISLKDFKELDHHLAAHLPRTHRGRQWQNIVYFFKEVERQQDQQRRLDDMERDALETVRRALEL